MDEVKDDWLGMEPFDQGAEEYFHEAGQSGGEGVDDVKEQGGFAPGLEAVALREVERPSQHVIDAHNLMDAKYAPWCQVCVAAKGAEAAHRRVPEDAQAGDRPLLQCDYMLLSRDGHQIGPDKAMHTIFVICDDRGACEGRVLLSRGGS